MNFRKEDRFHKNEIDWSFVQGVSEIGDQTLVSYFTVP